MGSNVEGEGVKIRVVRAKVDNRCITMCHGCIFDKGEGANFCYFRNACMAHLRPDREPVKFKSY